MPEDLINQQKDQPLKPIAKLLEPCHDKNPDDVQRQNTWSSSNQKQDYIQ